jgi:3-hydroxymyristoyl/3-hydroxydecanoyl-(acyl carrier protein) dehydratase
VLAGILLAMPGCVIVEILFSAQKCLAGWTGNGSTSDYVSKYHGM